MVKNFNLAISLLKKIRLIENIDAQNELLADIGKRQEPLIVAFLNAHGINLVINDETIGKSFLNTDIILRDGKGLEMLFKSAGLNPGFNMNGTDFIPILLEHFKSKKISIYGTEEPWLTRAKDNLQQNGYTIIDTCDGFQSPSFYLNRFRTSQPELVLLAMGMPKQEEIASLISRNHDDKCIIVCGGAIIDFLASRFSRAPRWMRTIGLEWLFRLINEPKRLFKRYVIGNVNFLLIKNRLVSGIRR